MKGVQSFLISLVVAVGLAFIIPEMGASGGWLRSEWTTKLGVFVIFFLQGLALPTDELRRGLMQWTLHAYCQVVIFVAIPVLFLVMTLLVGDGLSPDLKVGFLYLAILPTTLSTAVAFTTMANGNVAGALFNTSVSNIAGIFIVPVLATLITTQVGESQPILPLLGKIVSMLLLPLVLGQVMRPRLKEWVGRNKKHFSKINTYIIYFIIYATFCNAVKNRFWESQGIGVVLFTLVLTAVMLLLVTGLVYAGIRLLKMDPPNTVTALFCASQKTLAAGVPMAQSIFAGHEQLELGIVILPLMFYHPLQIALGGVLIPLLNKRS